jgi:hypothetical protein
MFYCILINVCIMHRCSNYWKKKRLGLKTEILYRIGK